MHANAFIEARKFVGKYLDSNKKLRILDVGAYNVNGVLKPLFVRNGVWCEKCGNIQKKTSDAPIMCSCCEIEMKLQYPNFGGIQNLEIGDDWEYIGLEIKEACEGIDISDPKYAGKNVDVIMVEQYKYPFADESIDVVVSTSCFEHDVMFWLSFKEMVRVSKNDGLIYLNTPSVGDYHAHPYDCWRFMKDSYMALSKWQPEAKLIEQYIDETSTNKDNIGIYKINK